MVLRSITKRLEVFNVGGTLSPGQEESKDKNVETITEGAKGEASVEFLAGIPGEVRMGVWPDAPQGWLKCDGALYDITTNPEYTPLKTIIGTMFNTGGETGDQFRVPNFDAKIPYGAGAATVGDDVGANTGDLTHAHTNTHGHAYDHYHETPQHDHQLTDHTHTFSDDHDHGGETGSGLSGDEIVDIDDNGTGVNVAVDPHDHSINSATVSGTTSAGGPASTEDAPGEDTSGPLAGAAVPKTSTDNYTGNTGNPVASLAAFDVRQASIALTFIIKW